VALTKILFEKWLGGGRTFTPMEPDVEKMLETCDAGLVIGDPALQVDRRLYHTLDLAEEWIRYTGKPFVFAFWAVRGDALREADPGLRVGLDESDVRSYLTENIHYQLDPGCLAGLQLFYHYAAELGALPVAPELRFVQGSRVFAD
ncbi:MAG: hypothetical protein DMG78_27550, partial [Acidobacteria bacterium]